MVCTKKRRGLASLKENRNYKGTKTEKYTMEMVGKLFFQIEIFGG